MSLMRTLAKVAIGVAVAKGAQSMMRSRASSSGGGSAGGLGGLLGGLMGGTGSQSSSSSQGGTGLESVMEGVFTGGGTTARAGTGAGGLGGMLDSLGSANTEATKSNRMDDLSDAYSDKTIDLGNKLPEDVRGNALSRNERQGSFGEVLNSQFGDDRRQPTAEQEAAAGLMIKAMIQAAKSDGQFDEAEQSKILDKLEDASASEKDYVRQELQAPVDPAALARETPAGLEAQVYSMSLLGIDLDTQEEAQHLHKLAEGLGLSRGVVNDIHERMGVPALYR